VTSTAPRPSSRAAARVRRRAAREDAIVAATRRLFDDRGSQDARVDEIARAAGINKALIYRAFASKEEIFALTATSYLEELRTLTDTAEAVADGPERLRAVLTVFADFCVTYPAFLDCGLSLLRRPAVELRAELADGSWFRVTRAVGGCVGVVQRALETIELHDPGFLAGRLLTQMMGSLHLARTGAILREPVPGAITAVPIAPEQVRDACVRDALATAGVAA
jgi:AcrR family transcriptional regulator